MNRIHKIIWSAIRERWVVVSEKAGAKGCPIIMSGMLSLAVLGAMSRTAMAVDPGELPTGGAITAGAGMIVTSGSSMTVTQTTPKLVAEWDTFNIGKDASVRFDQPGRDASALNIIHDRNPSEIFGSLTSNGQLFLLNSAGIIFGESAQVNVGGLVASTLDLSGSDYLAGNLDLKTNGMSGSVRNEGWIEAKSGGVVALIAPKVENSGTIKTDGGSVLMASGNKVSLDFAGDGLISYEIEEGAVNALVSNSKLISAGGGMVVMTAEAAEALTSAVVNNTGIVEAKTLGERSGRIMLLSDMDHGVTDVAGRLDASAPAGGDGGFIETSGAMVTVKDSAVITAASVSGTRGRWLIDPTDIVIDADSSTGTNGMSANAIMNALNGPTGDGSDGTNVTIATVATGSETGSITINAPITWYASGLTLQAHGDIDVDALMSWYGANLTLQAQRGININEAMTCIDGSIDLEPGAGSVVYGIRYGAFSGYVDFYQADGYTPRSGSGFLTIGGIPYTVISELGSPGDELSGSGAITLQGLANPDNFGGHYALGSQIHAYDTSSWNYSSDQVWVLDPSTSTWSQRDVGYQGFRPIGSDATPFTGVFDGLGHSITWMYINRPLDGGVGMFGTISDTQIRNLELYSFDVTGDDATGALVGEIADGSEVTISAIHNEQSKISGNTATGGIVGDALNSVITIADTWNHSWVKSPDNFVGGIIGAVSGEAHIESTYNSGYIECPYGIAGGLVGLFDGINLTIDNSYNDSDIVCAGRGNYIGGLVGWGTMGTITINKSFNRGDVSGSLDDWGMGGVGGLVGYAHYVTISESFNNGSVEGAAAVGGLVGYADQVSITDSFNAGNGERVAAIQYDDNGDPSHSDYAGGLVGQAGERIEVRNSYNDAPVYFIDGVTDHVGGILGGGSVATQVDIRNTFWNLDVNPDLATNSLGGTPETAAELQTLSTFTSAGWDIDDVGGTGKIWRMYTLDPETGFATSPLLRHFLAPLIVRPNDQEKTYGTELSLLENQVTTTPGGVFTVPGLEVDEQNGLLRSSSGPSVMLECDGLALTALAGTYPIRPESVSGASFNIADYDIIFQNGLLTVDPKPLDVTGNRVYDGTTTYNANLLTIDSSGLVGTDSLPMLSGSAEVSGKNVGLYTGWAVNGLSLDNPNYTLIGGKVDVEITPDPVTVALLNGTRPYDGTTDAPASILTITNKLLTDDLTLSGTGVLKSKNVGVRGFASVGDLTLGGADAGNYILTGITTNGSSVTITSAEYVSIEGWKTYDGSADFEDNRVMITGVNGEYFMAPATADSKNATDNDGATRFVIVGTVTGADDASLPSNYKPLDPDTISINTATIHKNTMSVWAPWSTVTYNGAIQTQEPYVDGIIGGDDITINGKAAGRNVGTYYSNLTVSGSDAGNYSIYISDGHITIDSAPLKVKPQNDSKSYGATTTSGGATYDESGVASADGSGALYTVTGLQTGDSVTGLTLNSAGGPSSASVGSYAISISDLTGSGLSNYDITYETGVLDVNPVSLVLTITPQNDSKTYGSSTTVGGATYVNGVASIGAPGALYSVSGLQSGDSVSGIQLTSAGGYATAAVGEYAITGSNATGTGLSNYTLSYVGGAILTVDKAPLTVKANSLATTYNGEAQSVSGFTATGLVNGETAGVLSGVTASGSGTNAGTYDVVASGTDENYNLTFEKGVLDIGKASATVKANSLVTTYNGEAQSVSGFTATGLVNGETVGVLSGVSASGSGTNAGTYDVVASGTDENYNLTFEKGVLDIGRAPLTVTADDATKTYGQSLTFSGHEFSSTGTYTDDKVDKVTLASDGSSAEAPMSGNPYPIMASAATGTGLDNYDITYRTGNLTIAPAPNDDIEVITGSVTLRPRDIPVEIPDSVMSETQPEMMIGVISQDTTDESTEEDAVRVSRTTTGSMAVKVPAVVSKAGSKFWFPLPKEILNGSAPSEVKVAMADGAELPGWLRYDTPSMIFTAVDIPDDAMPLNVLVSVATRSLIMEIRSETGSGTIMMTN